MDKGGEGIILRDPDAGYIPGRSSGFLKHKVSNDTALPIFPLIIYLLQEIQGCRGPSNRSWGTTKPMGMPNVPPSLVDQSSFLSLIDFFYVRPNGVLFTAVAGTTEFAKRWNPQKGDIVSFKHHGFMLGSKKPKMATLYRLRPDLSWDTLVDTWKEQKPVFTGNPTCTLITYTHTHTHSHSSRSLALTLTLTLSHTH